MSEDKMLALLIFSGVVLVGGLIFRWVFMQFR